MAGIPFWKIQRRVWATSYHKDRPSAIASGARRERCSRTRYKYGVISNTTAGLAGPDWSALRGSPGHEDEPEVAGRVGRAFRSRNGVRSVRRRQRAIARGSHTTAKISQAVLLRVS